MTGDDLVTNLAALAHPLRIRALALLHKNGAVHVSELARMVGISRPLLILHVRKLEAAGLIKSKMKLSDDGKAMNMLSVTPFSLEVNPKMLAEVASSLTLPSHAKLNQTKDKK
ncbi:MAG: transcriptional regulator [Sneathiella sp.]|nr:MAG: transcriptional regulator [Sneathiella sp.]